MSAPDPRDIDLAERQTALLVELASDMPERRDEMVALVPAIFAPLRGETTPPPAELAAAAEVADGG